MIRGLEAEADILAICTEWSQFRAPDFDLLAQKLGSKVIVDGRNMFDPIYLSRLGFTYYGIGRGDSIKSGEN